MKKEEKSREALMQELRIALANHQKTQKVIDYCDDKINTPLAFTTDGVIMMLGMVGIIKGFGADNIALGVGCGAGLLYGMHSLRKKMSKTATAVYEIAKNYSDTEKDDLVQKRTREQVLFLVNGCVFAFGMNCLVSGAVAKNGIEFGFGLAMLVRTSYNAYKKYKDPKIYSLEQKVFEDVVFGKVKD